MNLAVLMACHNRRETTLRCLRSLHAATKELERGTGEWTVNVFLVDDGSTDGTGTAVASWYENLPPLSCSNFKLHLIVGSGDLFWAKGKALAWREALKCESARHSPTSHFDFFLWLNDDVELFPDALADLLKDSSAALHLHLGSTPVVPPVLVGECRDESGNVSYGATNEKNRLMAPNGRPQRVNGWFTGNVVFVPREVCDRIGIIDGAYTHARADFDYAERLKRAGLPFFSTSRFVGICKDDSKDKMRDKTFGERLAALWRPGYSNLHDLWLIRSRYHGRIRALVSCLHMVCLVFRKER